MNMSPETENHDEYTRSETVTVIQESENVYIREKKKKKNDGWILDKSASGFTRK